MLATLLIAFACLPGGAANGQAQGASASTTYITPFPQGDRYQLRVIGDWYGAPLNAALQEALRSETSLDIADMSRSGYSAARAEQTGLWAEIGKISPTAPVHIAVIMLGMNDRQAVRSANSYVLPGSAEWKELYGKEAEKLTKKLRSAGVAVYWVGLPPMSNSQLNEFAASFNDTVRQAAYLNGAKFVDTLAGFTDQTGAFTPWGTDVSGQMKRLREGDGAGLTQIGYAKIASFIEISIRRDLSLARAQRNIPLAGDEEEQARLLPGAVHGLAAKSPAGDWGARPAAGAFAWKTETGPVKTALPGEPAAGMPGPDAARPGLAALSGETSQQGEYILSDLSGGLTSIAVVTPVGDLSMRELQRQTPLAERIYFKVLSKGEALPAKEGRADDFRWRGEEAVESR